MKFKNVVQDNSGVSPVIGIILILSIVTVSIAIIYSSGVPFIDSAKQNTQLVSTTNSFTVLQNDILEVTNGPVTGIGTGRITKMDLGGGSLSVEPNETKIQIDYSTESIIVYPGTISYEYKGREVYYENGAVFSKYTTSSFMEAEPRIYASNLGSGNIGLMIHIINITGSNTSIGSTNSGKIRTLLSSDGQNYHPIYLAIYVDNVTITITSQNNDSWGSYFNETLTRAGLSGTTQFSIVDLGENREKIIIYGSRNPGDIYLSIYETQIEINAE
jgi:hypothetical protein